MKKKTFDPLTVREAVDTAIQAHLGVLILRLQQAERRAVEAASAMGAEQRDLAIDTILPLERMLPECDAVLRGALILHRMEPQNKERGAA